MMEDSFFYSCRIMMDDSNFYPQRRMLGEAIFFPNYPMQNERISLPITSSVAYDPLTAVQNIEAMTAFEGCISTSIGICGKLTLRPTRNGGLLIIESTRGIIPIDSIDMRNPIIKLIVDSAMSSYNNYSLACILLNLKLIIHTMESVYPLPLSGNLFEHFGKLFVNFLNSESNNCVTLLDFSNLEGIKRVVGPMIATDPDYICSEEEVTELSALIMKLQFESGLDEESEFYRKNYRFDSFHADSTEHSQLLEGLLIRLPDRPVRNMIVFNKEINIKIVLYTISFSGNSDVRDEIVDSHGISIWEDAVPNYLQDVVEKIIKMEVHIFACRYVVHPTLKKLLEDADVVVLDKLGGEVAQNLFYLLGVSNSCYDSEPIIGYITSVRHEYFGGYQHLLLTNRHKPFWTMLVFNAYRHASRHLQAVLNKLFHLSADDHLCCGAWCTDIYTMRLVEKEVKENLEDLQQEFSCTSSEILGILQNFLQSITDVAIAANNGSAENCVSETKFNHLWKLQNDDKVPSTNDKCLCGKMNAKDVADSEWTYFKTDSSIKTAVKKKRKKKKNEPERISIVQALILDEQKNKVFAYSVACKTAAILLRASLYLHG